MKITEVKVHLVVPYPNAEPVMPGYRGAWTFVQICTDTDLYGLGECTNWPHGSDVMVAQTIRAMTDTLIGLDPHHIEHIWNELFRHYTYLGNRGVVPTAISGIDTALWDLKGKALGRPVYDLLGGPLRQSTPLYTHPGGQFPDRIVEHAVTLREQGFTAFKFDPFFEVGYHHTSYRSGEISKVGVRQAAEIIAAVRAAVGPDTEILIDFHGQYNVASALRCIDALLPYDITWFEEPLPPEGLAGLRQIRAQTPAPLCVGERLFTRWDFAPIIDEGLVNYIMPDVGWTGGITELRKIAILAETRFLPVAPHGLAGPLQPVVAAHAMLATPNFFRLEMAGPGTIDAYNRCLAEPLDIHDGHLFLTDRPGFGVDLDWDYVRAHPHPAWPTP